MTKDQFLYIRNTVQEQSWIAFAELVSAAHVAAKNRSDYITPMSFEGYQEAMKNSGGVTIQDYKNYLITIILSYSPN